MEKCFILIIIVFMPVILSAQNSFSSTGGDASGTGGTLSFTLGQVSDDYSESPGLNISEGIQQPYEIFIITEINDEFSDLSLSVFPNPTTYCLELNIENNDSKEFTCILFDSQSKIVINESFTDASIKLETSSLPAGTYILKVLCENKHIQSFKIIKN
ncbi:MAG: T9SS type A sorting domain-containing protein [Spirochaetes bacterium]|nr:T9SS type A sorting domain-containing protein [Spirochaetota bacterium]